MGFSRIQNESRRISLCCDLMFKIFSCAARHSQTVTRPFFGLIYLNLNTSLSNIYRTSIEHLSKIRHVMLYLNDLNCCISLNVIVILPTIRHSREWLSHDIRTCMMYTPVHCIWNTPCFSGRGDIPLWLQYSLLLIATGGRTMSLGLKYCTRACAHVFMHESIYVFSIYSCMLFVCICMDIIYACMELYMYGCIYCIHAWIDVSSCVYVYKCLWVYWCMY